ncbi:phage tail protein [Paraburkholderia phenoliruptrix]|uniref:phage tail protein n=1 Tax=Paraburkholderia phenoliruptrix TaxID=252970 RepID=UPI0034CE5F53
MGARSGILALLAALLTPDGSGNVLAYQTPQALDNSLKYQTTAGANAIGPVVGSARNVRMQLTAASANATLTADEVIVETALGGAPFRLSSINLSINLATTGAGGMDTGSAPASGYLAIYLIYNPTTNTQALLGFNATAAAAPNVYGGANMPPGYTASALVSVVPTNSSGQILALTQIDRCISRSSVQVFTTTTTTQSQGVTSLSIASAVPKNAISVSGTIGITPNNNAPVISLFSDAQQNGAQISDVWASTTVSLTTPYNSLDIFTPQTMYYSWGNTNTNSTSYYINITKYKF